MIEHMIYVNAQYHSRIDKIFERKRQQHKSTFEHSPTDLHLLPAVKPFSKFKNVYIGIDSTGSGWTNIHLVLMPYLLDAVHNFMNGPLLIASHPNPRSRYLLFQRFEKSKFPNKFWNIECFTYIVYPIG